MAERPQPKVISLDQAPASAIELQPITRQLLPVDTEQRFELRPGPNEIELRVRELIGVRFTFRDGEATIPWNWAWRLSAHRIDDELPDRSRSIGILWFLEEGTYELRSNEIPGFGSIDGTRMNREANDLSGKLVHDNHDPMGLQDH